MRVTESDEILMDKVLDKRDLDALNVLCERYWKPFYNHALYTLRNQADAEEAAQDIFAKILKALPDYRRQSKVGVWWYRIAHNTVTDFVRRRYSSKKAMAAVAADWQEESAMDQEDISSQELQDAMFALDDELRLPLQLYYFQKCKQEDIAGILECSQKTVSVRIREGVEALQEKFSDKGPLAGSHLGIVLAAVTLQTMPSRLAEAGQIQIANQAAAMGLVSGGSGVAGAVAIFTVGGIAMTSKMILTSAALAIMALVLGFGTGKVMPKSNEPAMAESDTSQSQVLANEAALKEVNNNLLGMEHGMQERRDRISNLRDELGALETSLSALPEVAGTHAITMQPDSEVQSREDFFQRMEQLAAGFEGLSETEKAELPEGFAMEAYVYQQVAEWLPMYLYLKDDMKDFGTVIVDRMATEENSQFLEIAGIFMNGHFEFEEDALPVSMTAHLLQAAGQDIPDQNRKLLYAIALRSMKWSHRNTKSNDEGQPVPTIAQKEMSEIAESFILDTFQEGYLDDRLRECLVAVKMMDTLQQHSDSLGLSLQSFLLSLPVASQPTQEEGVYYYYNSGWWNTNSAPSLYALYMEGLGKLAKHYAGKDVAAFLQTNFSNRDGGVFAWHVEKLLEIHMGEFKVTEDE